MWEWTKGVLPHEELNKEFFFAKDEIERTAWYVAAHNDNLDILYQLWEWTKELLTQEELNNKLFLAKHIGLLQPGIFQQRRAYYRYYTNCEVG